MFHKFLISFFCCMSSAAYAIGLNESVANSLPIEESITISMHTSNKAMGESLFINSSEQRQLQLNLVETQPIQLHLLSNNQLETIFNPVSGENKSRRTLSLGVESKARLADNLQMSARVQYKANDGETPRAQRNASINYTNTMQPLAFGVTLEFAAKDAQAALSKLIDVYTPPLDFEEIDDVEATHVKQVALTIEAATSRFNNELMFVSAEVNNPILKGEDGVLINQTGDLMRVTYLSTKSNFTLGKNTTLFAHAAPLKKTSELNSESIRFTAYKVGAKFLLRNQLESSILIKRGDIKAYQLSNGGAEKLALNLRYKFSPKASLRVALSQPIANSFGDKLETRMLVSAAF